MKIVNQSIPKIDGIGILTGKPAYTDDIASEHSLVIKLYKSPHAFARIKNINTDKAKALFGVEAIYTYKDVPQNPFTRAGQAYPESSPYDKYILDEYVRFVGDPVALVVAINEDIAKEAMELIEVEYQVLEPVLDYETAIGHKSIIHNKDRVEVKVDVGSDFDNNINGKVDIAKGDVDKALEESEVVIKRRYRTQANNQTPLETFRSAASIDQNGRLVIVSSTQVPFHVKRIVARALGISSSKVRVIKPRIGGGFGAKQTIHCEIYVAFVTWMTKKPSKLIYTRRENFESGSPRHKMRMDVTIGSDKEGNIKAIDIEGLSDSGAHGEHGPSVFLQVGMKSLDLYNRTEAVRFTGDVVYTNTPASGAFRGYGATQGIYAVESVINELAVELGMDPILLREKNMVKEGEEIENFNFNGVINNGPKEIMESCALDKCVERGRELIDWDNKYPKRENGDKVRGVGMAIGRQGSGIAGVDMAKATINLCDDGTFTLLVGATDIGTGSDTILSQICAESLNIPFENIIIVSSDTDTTPYDGGAYASSTTYVTGNAVKKAADEMRELIISEGAIYFNTDSEKIDFDGEYIIYKGYDKKISLGDFANELIYSQKQLTTSSSYLAHKSPPPYMGGFAEVEVDMETGFIEVIDFVSVLDVGTMINPTLAKTQVEGGTLQGIGMALFEEVQVGPTGRLRTGDLKYYNIPKRTDVKKITVDFVESYEPTGPYGAKSIGEVVTNTASPAIQDAVYNATGVRIRDLPITPEKLLKALKEKALEEINEKELV